jgi:hypothetical protein
MIEKNIKLFKRFLKEEGVFKAFQQNFQPGFFEEQDYLVEQGSDSFFLKSYLEVCRDFHAVSRAFCWETTAQGFLFWARINCKWLTILDLTDGKRKNS